VAAFAGELYCDNALDRAVRQLWHRLDARRPGSPLAAIAGVRPHVSLVVLDLVDGRRWSRLLASCAKSQRLSQCLAELAPDFTPGQRWVEEAGAIEVLSNQGAPSQTRPVVFRPFRRQSVGEGWGRTGPLGAVDPES
jgi:hypothetical protein